MMGKKYIFGVAIVGIMAFAGLFAMNANAQEPNEVWVDDDAAPEWYDSTHVKTIQEGITNVSAGGTVHVHDGTYRENVVVNKERR
ncbi:MAG: hypothetical protein U9O96_07800 [Candidatus Thermoplasmatota archaeon]|nr:hypothetical protein [Candidatus Thermoplasmatota archaeon]